MSTNSGYHIQYYAHLAAEQGISVIIAVPRIDDDERFMFPSLDVRTYDDVEENGVLFSDGRGPDIVHAWTPREIVRRFCARLERQYSFQTIIHLEDNEHYLTEAAGGRPWNELMNMPVRELDGMIPETRFHPVRGWKWLKQVHGVSMIIDTLQCFNPSNLPSAILPAPVDERLFYPRPVNHQLRQTLQIPDHHVVLAYTGDVRPLKQQEAEQLYQAVAMLNEQGLPTTLIRTGKDYVSFGDNESRYKQHEKPMGWVDREKVPEVLAAADILVQPGQPGPFDDHRIPAKLPEYFAMGRPVILPKANLGQWVDHGREGYVLERADAQGIARAVQELNKDRKWMQDMGNAAVDFYLHKCSVPVHAPYALYQTVTQSIQ